MRHVVFSGTVKMQNSISFAFSVSKNEKKNRPKFLFVQSDYFLNGQVRESAATAKLTL
jgi:hypothetical protein